MSRAVLLLLPQHPARLHKRLDLISARWPASLVELAPLQRIRVGTAQPIRAEHLKIAPHLREVSDRHGHIGRGVGTVGRFPPFLHLSVKRCVGLIAGQNVQVRHDIFP